MNRLIPTAVAVALVMLVCDCDLSSSSKPDPKEKRPAQMSMVSAADELAARSRLQAIVTAEIGYAATSPSGQYATLEELMTGKLSVLPRISEVVRKSTTREEYSHGGT